MRQRGAPAGSPGAWLCAGALAWAVGVFVGCEPNGGFEPPPPEGLCGAIVANPAIRDGFPEALEVNLRLRLDTLDSLPATLRSLEDPLLGPCAPRPLFEDAPIRVNRALSADSLSGLEFGPQRLINIVGSVQPSCGPAMLAVVSLMANDNVELRLLSPRENQPLGFGLFVLARDGCSTGT